MARVRRPNLAPEAARRTAEQLARAGSELRTGRTVRRLTQTAAGDRAGIGRGVVSRIERGKGGSVPLDAWQRLGLAVGRLIVVTVQRDICVETADAGHLAVQELVLGIGRAAGYTGSFELPTRPAEAWRSADVGLADERRRRMIHVECWNTIGDIGAAVRSSNRKRAELEALAAGRWGPDATVGVVWVVRASARNRALVGRYPEVFRRAFPGSSRRWLAAVTTGAAPPSDAGLLWSDVGATRLYAWRQP